MKIAHISLNILCSFIFPMASTSLEWQIHVTQGSKDKFRGFQITNISNIHRIQVEWNLLSAIASSTIFFPSIVNIRSSNHQNSGRLVNFSILFTPTASPPLCNTKATVWSKVWRARADGAESKRWKNLPVSSVCRAAVPNGPQEWLPPRMGQELCRSKKCKTISSNKVTRNKYER